MEKITTCEFIRKWKNVKSSYEQTERINGTERSEGWNEEKRTLMKGMART